MALPVRLEDDLLAFAVIGPASGDLLGAFGRTAMQKHHVGMFGLDPVQCRPDGPMVGDVEPAGEGDPWPGGQKRFDLRASLRRQKVAAVDHGRCQRTVTDP